MNEDRQLILPLDRTPRRKNTAFITTPANSAARAWLFDTAWPEGRLVIWGEKGSGKTHLLQEWAVEKKAIVLEGREVGLSAFEKAQADTGLGHIAIDNADQIRSEPALLHLLNFARERGFQVLLTASTAPARWPLRLPDLSSRIKATVATMIGQPDDVLLRGLMMRLLAEREIIVAQPVVEWLLRRLPRTTSAIEDAVNRLDRTGLAHGEPITRAFASRVLAAAE